MRARKPKPPPAGKLRKRNHASVAAAKRELSRLGYFPLCQDPETGIEPWARAGLKGRRYAVASERRPRSVVYHLVEVST